MKTLMQHRALVAIAVAGLAVAAAQADTGARGVQWKWAEAARVVDAVPPLPPPTTFPVQLVLDDDSADGSVGVASQTARQFLWFNRFSPAAGFHLEEVWVLFPAGSNMAVGGAVQIAIYDDADGDPSNGATLLQSFDTTIQAADGNTFSIYTLPASVLIETGRDLLVGVVPRFIVSGVTSPTTPAALDTTTSQARSWIALWSTDPPDPPALVPLPDQAYLLVDALVPGGGNWMIRAFGSEQGVTEIPTLGEWGLVALALALLAAGVVLLRRRSRGGVGAALALALLALAVPAGAVTIDTFTTNQAALTDPPGGNSTATGGADILGTRRGMVIDLLTGAGPTTASVAGGNLALAITATTPDSRGEVLVSWDADTNALVLSPTGLGNADLTAGDASGFQLAFASTTVVTEVEITVYDDAANFSRAARRVPVSGAAQSVRIPFAEFRVAGGAGADFASVGAIEMTIRGGEGTITLNEVTTTAPTVAATKVDTQIVDTDVDTRVDPGDRVRYTVTVTNTGNQALAVDLSDTIDANTTLVAGSVSSTPVAHNDQYGWFGNVTLNVDDTPALPGLLANDDDADGDAVTVQSGTFPALSALGGNLSLVDATTGEFTYSPPVGFAGVDSFNYTILDDNGNTSTATANIALEGVIWFVDDSNTTAPFNGTLADPFQTLASVNAVGDPDQPGDTIFVFDDDGTPYAGGLALEADQTLLGEAAGLILSGTTIVPVGNRPQITNAAGVGLTLATSNTLGGFDVQNTSGAGIFGSAFGTLTATNVNVLTTGGATLDLTNGALSSVVFGTLSSTGAGGQRGLNLSTLTGSLTATSTSLTNPTTDGILVSGSAGASFSFGATTVTDNAIGSGATGDGVDVATGNAGATFNFGSLAVTSDAGAGLRANGSGTINIGGTGNSISSTGGPAVDITSTSLGSGATFATLSSTNSTGKGVNLDTVTGTFTGNGGSINDAGGVCFDVNGGSSNITYNGNVTCTANAFLVEITGRTGGTVTLSGNLWGSVSSNGINVASNTGGTINFSGGVKTMDTGADAAVTLANNSGATINFTGGGLDIDTTSGTGFNATGGATAITVTGPANSILANGSGTALNVVNTSIGSAGLNFFRISAGTGAGSVGNGIHLDSTGLAAGNGGLTVAGLGFAGSGGTIQNKTGANGSTTSGIGIYLNNTKSPSFNWMQLNDFENFGIRGFNVAGFSLANSTINSSSGLNGNDDASNEGSIAFGNDAGLTGLTGTVSITNCVVANGFENNFLIANHAGTMTFNMTGSTIRDNRTVSPGNEGLSFQAEGSASMTIDIVGSSFLRNRANGIHVINQSTGTVNFDLGTAGTAGSGGTFTDNTLGVNINGNDSGATNFNVLFATFTVPNFPTLYGAGGASSQINLNLGGDAVVAERGAMTGNLIGNSINTNLSPTGPAVRIIANGTDGTGGNSITVKLDSNSITGGENFGVHVLTRDGNAGINATITNNTVTTNDGPLIPGNGAAEAIRVDAGVTSSAAGTGVPDSGFVNLDLAGNNAETPDATGLFDVRIRQRFGTTYRLEDYGGAVADDAAVAAYLAARNPSTTGTNTFTADHAATGSAGFLNIADVPEPPAP